MLISAFVGCFTQENNVKNNNNDNFERELKNHVGVVTNYSFFDIFNNIEYTTGTIYFFEDGFELKVFGSRPIILNKNIKIEYTFYPGNNICYFRGFTSV